MSNCVFGFPIQSDPSPLYTTVLSGGSWVATLPATNVLDRKLNRLARSTNATTGATTFGIDLGRVCSIGLLASLVPNITKSSTPTIQWYAGTTAGTNDIYNPGALQAFPSGLTIDDITGPDGSQQNIWHVLTPTAFNARYLVWAIDDHLNADGHVDVARVVIAGAYRPSVCMQTGAKSQLENNTVETETDGGACLYQVKRNRRTDVFTLPNVGRQESLESIRRMEQRLGKSGQTFFVWDETDTYKYERAYLATLRSLGALEYNLDALHSTVAYEVAEVL